MKYLSWSKHINSIINIDEEINDFSVELLFYFHYITFSNFSFSLFKISNDDKEKWITKWQTFLNSSQKQILPRAQHDERQAFYTACLLYNQRQTISDFKESPSEFQTDMDHHIHMNRYTLSTYHFLVLTNSY